MLMSLRLAVRDKESFTRLRETVDGVSSQLTEEVVGGSLPLSRLDQYPPGAPKTVDFELHDLNFTGFQTDPGLMK
ncbi:hypothetical protein KGM_209198 [Danaus plexippus plexippus]|uniref:Uncharacterized protein n=1 Tax=Danaus plexippus plexippus TaxID=278856 RepID=A0A212F8K8_DANPL|nr:hypothetical protein KGM_209198 [Danaus plexippus plexippus]